MAYTKKNPEWSTGQLITAEDLNHMEQGIYDNSETINKVEEKVEDFSITYSLPLGQLVQGSISSSTGKVNSQPNSQKRVRWSSYFLPMGVKKIDLPSKQYAVNNTTKEILVGIFGYTANGTYRGACSLDSQGNSIFITDSSALGSLGVNVFQHLPYTLPEVDNTFFRIVFGFYNDTTTSDAAISSGAVLKDYLSTKELELTINPENGYSQYQTLYDETTFDNTNGDDDISMRYLIISKKQPIVVGSTCTYQLDGNQFAPTIKLGCFNYNKTLHWSMAYKLGDQNYLTNKEFRAPSYSLWKNYPISMEIIIPKKCKLEISKMYYYYENSLTKNKNNSLIFTSRGTCNLVPDLSPQSILMSYRHGFDTYTVIPKVSKDGVWFAYHDDNAATISLGTSMSPSDAAESVVKMENLSITDKTGATIPITLDSNTFEYRTSASSAPTSVTKVPIYFDDLNWTGCLDQFKISNNSDVGISNDIDVGINKLMTLDTCFELLSRLGMKLRLSLHPAIGVNDHLSDLKFLIQKYGLLKDLTIIVNNWDQVYSAFQKDIAGYIFTASNLSISESDLTNIQNNLASPLSKVNWQEVTANGTQNLDINFICAWFASSIFAGKNAGIDVKENYIKPILNRGYKCAIFEGDYNVINPLDNSTFKRSQFTGEDIEYLRSIGITDFTVTNHTSLGLNW